MKRFKSIRHAQRFLSAFSGISPHFRPRRHLLSAADYRQVMADRFAVWNEITGATTTAAACIGDWDRTFRPSHGSSPRIITSAN